MIFQSITDKIREEILEVKANYYLPKNADEIDQYEEIDFYNNSQAHNVIHHLEEAIEHIEESYEATKKIL